MAIMLKKLTDKNYLKDHILPFFSLFTSLSTIFCCALPIILVSIGMGATFASLSANFPFINIAAKYSLAIFVITAILLILSGYFIFIKPQTCPIDKKLAEICIKTKKINKIIWLFSVIIFALSVFFKYVLILLVA